MPNVKNSKEGKTDGWQTESVPRKLLPAPTSSLFNRTFYRFLFGFVAVVTSVLIFILVLGASS